MLILLDQLGKSLKLSLATVETTLPRGLAVPANEGNEASLKNQLKVLEKKKEAL